MAQLIDTSVFVTMERRGLPFDALLASAPDEPASIAAITASELLAGVYRADTPERRTKREAFVESVFDAFTPLPFDLRTARVHAEAWAHLRTAGRSMGAHDLLIAATALAHGYAVLTDDVRDFERVSGLEVRRPDW